MTVEPDRTTIPGIVSIVVPVYRVEDLLHRCVDSILAQTYPHFELILVDDGSPDRSGEICDAYAAADPRIRCIHQENGGLSSARNTGIESSHGDYLTFIDSDDWVADTYLETLVTLMDDHDCEIAVGAFLRSWAGGNEPSDGGIASLVEMSSMQALTGLYGAPGVLLTVAWGKLYTREVVGDVRFPVGRLHEDIYASCRLLHRANRVVITPEPLYHYWQRPDSITGTARTGSCRALRDALDGFADNAAFLGDVGLPGLQLKALRRAVDYYTDLVRIYPPGRSADPADWNRAAAREIRLSLRRGLARCAGPRGRRAVLYVKLHLPRAVGLAAARLRRMTS